ncbi:response regulator [Tenacibaculum bernardetii]|uniref:response regulator n=1 Tax=Tenacibaculum bernardetii TaxID=3021375 RepID=UPI0023AFA8A0|nr:response regulator [Tenacibaculum bernardetii]
MKKILLIEDEFIIAKDLQILLEKETEYIVSVARNYSQAVDTFQKESIDIIICDINLNDHKDGIHFIKNTVPKNSIPVIYLTAYSQPNIIERAKNTTPFSYLLKPFNENQLKVTIELALLNYKKVKLNIKEDTVNTEKTNSLTKREREVLIVLASGKTSKETGILLNISSLTVEKHKKNIKEKLNLNTIGELIHFTMSSNLYVVS